MSNVNTISPEHRQAIDALRDLGFAVIVFTPKELDGVSPDHVEDHLEELGWDVIANSEKDY